MADRERRLRIAQVNTEDSGGGAQSSAWNLFQAYRSRGHDSWLAVGRKYSDDPDVFVTTSLRKGPWSSAWLAAHDGLEPLVGRMRGVGRLRSWLRTIASPRRALERELGIEDFNFPGTSRLLQLFPHKPDLVHCHNLHGDYFDLQALPRLSREVPIVLNLRDSWLLTGHCAGTNGCDRWTVGCGRCPDLEIYPAIKRDATAFNWRRKRDIFERSRLYIAAPSQWLMEQVQVSMLNGVQHRVIPNAIDLTVFQPGNQAEARIALGLPIDHTIVMLTAQNEFKDFQMMEAALGELTNGDGADLTFICLGRSGEEKRVGQGRMLFFGFERNPMRMAQYYRASDVFIHAAKSEVFGKVVTEAMACGVPVVATSIGGIPSQLEDGKTGLLVSPEDGTGMAAAIERLLADVNLRGSLIKAATTDATRRFGLEQQVNAFLDWYPEILDDWKSQTQFA